MPDRFFKSFSQNQPGFGKSSILQKHSKFRHVLVGKKLNAHALPSGCGTGPGFGFSGIFMPRDR
jgi:hypothetical protein